MYQRLGWEVRDGGAEADDRLIEAEEPVEAAAPVHVQDDAREQTFSDKT